MIPCMDKDSLHLLIGMEGSRSIVGVLKGMSSTTKALLKAHTVINTQGHSGNHCMKGKESLLERVSLMKEDSLTGCFMEKDA